ncbi:unnamed protein product [Enterobius vermicularis]|uniref:G_PROTEIN_RECEP_F1_2 domain-containing protein n=1 Tax=Enterobius vermicularis TaxID=51028 RepID=A0A0N4VKX4_ENTVE|nr:unnamed protein product [Enterobius vermicularis]
MDYNSLKSVRDCFVKAEGVDSYRLAHGLILSAATGIGIISCLLLLAVFYICRAQTRFSTFKLFLSLNIAAIVYHVAGCIVMLPCTFTDCQFYSDNVIVSLAWLDTLGYYSSMFTNFLIAVERISMFHCTKLHQWIEDRRLLYISIAWMIGCAITVGTTSMKCFKRSAL